MLIVARQAIRDAVRVPSLALPNIGTKAMRLRPCSGLSKPFLIRVDRPTG